MPRREKKYLVLCKRAMPLVHRFHTMSVRSHLRALACGPMCAPVMNIVDSESELEIQVAAALQYVGLGDPAVWSNIKNFIEGSSQPDSYARDSSTSTHSIEEELNTMQSTSGISKWRYYTLMCVNNSNKRGAFVNIKRSLDDESYTWKLNAHIGTFEDNADDCEMAWYRHKVKIMTRGREDSVSRGRDGD